MGFKLTETQVFGEETPILLSIQDYHAWTPQGEKGERLGTTYHVLALGEYPSIVQVKVPDKAFPLAVEVLHKRNSNIQKGNSFMRVRFYDFQARPYMNKAGKMALSCKAIRAELVDEDEVLIG